MIFELSREKMKKSGDFGEKVISYCKKRLQYATGRSLQLVSVLRLPADSLSCYLHPGLIETAPDSALFEKLRA